MRYGMVLDLTRCVGCAGCATACKVTNNLPDGVWWNTLRSPGDNLTALGTYPDVRRTLYTVSCQHCDNPACAKVCPVGATWKDEETGIVRQDYDKCIGCRMCMAACPYTGVRSFNWEEPAYVCGHMMGDADVPAHHKHTVSKCTFCYQRISKGKTPGCMQICPMKARHFGDLDDPDSEVSKLIATRSYAQLLPEKGTRPSVYYLV